MFHKTSFQKAIVPTGIFSKKALFQWDCVSARTPFRETVSQELLSEELFQQELFSKEPCLQRNSFSRNCSTKSPVSGRLFQTIYSMCRNQTISPNIVPRNCFQGLFFLFSKYPCQETVSKACFYYCLNHISKPYLQTSFQETVSKACFFYSLNIHVKTRSSFQETVSKACFCYSTLTQPIISKHPFDGSKRALFSRSVIPFRHSVPSFRSVIPSLPHFTIPSLRFCLHGIMMERLYHSYKESFPQTSKVSKVSKESFHQKIVSGNKPFWQRIIPSKFPNINITNSIPSKNSIWE